MLPRSRKRSDVEQGAKSETCERFVNRPKVPIVGDTEGLHTGLSSPQKSPEFIVYAHDPPPSRHFPKFLLHPSPNPPLSSHSSTPCPRPQ